MMQFAFLTWFLVALFSLRWFGISYMNKPDIVWGDNRCHGELKNGSRVHPESERWDCDRRHKNNCWRPLVTEVPKIERTTADGFRICFLALCWPVLIWPYLALWITPETNSEKDYRIKQLEAEVDRLEKEASAS